MYYKLREEIGLRGWEERPYNLRHFPSGETMEIGEEFFQALSFCDGSFPVDSLLVPPSAKQMIDLAIKRGAVVKCEKGETLTEKQKYKLYPSKYITSAHWSITGKCNMKCRHCYMSAPEAKFGEISHEMAMNIVEQLGEMGVAKVSLTGGEPLVREDFMQIVDGLLERDIIIHQIYTNGLLVNDALLNELDKRKCKPEFSFSHDGIGWHDWMRGHEGAEEVAINAIKLCVSRGFPVTIESAFHKKNIHTIVDTMFLLADLGVSGWKTNPVGRTGNWLKEDESIDLSIQETFDAYLNLIDKYLEAGSPITMMLGGLFMCQKGSKNWTSPIVKPYKDAESRMKEVLCPCARYTMYISADAKLLPCMPLAGMPIQEGYASLTDTTINEAMKASTYWSHVNATLEDLKANNSECGECEYFLNCNGGCRAAGLQMHDGLDYYSKDSWTCVIFKDNLQEKIKKIVETHCHVSPDEQCEKHNCKCSDHN